MKKKPVTMKELAKRIDLEELGRSQNISTLEKRISESAESIKNRYEKLDARLINAEHWIKVNEKLFIDIRNKMKLISAIIRRLTYARARA